MGIKRLYRPQLVVTDQVAEIKCNKCGKSHDLLADPHSAFDFHEITLQGGYGDEFPSDMETISFVICGTCLKEWVDTFEDPDVVVGSMHGVPLKAKHSETLAELQVRPGLWAWPANEDEPSYDQGEPDTDEEVVEDGLWKHYKGGRYAVLGYAFMYPSAEPVVVYMALYGDSGTWVRPLSMWHQEAERGVPRFKRIDGT